MEKTFKVLNLDCANCAAKFENAVKKIDGVHSAQVNFLTEKLIIEADENAFDTIIERAKKELKKVERDGELYE